MNIISVEIFSWFALLVAVYWVLPRSLQLGWVVLVTSAFLLVYSPISLAIMVLVSISAYYLLRYRIALPIVTSIAIFIIYRVMSSDGAFSDLSAPDAELISGNAFVLLGFSYFILRVLHYLFERAKGTCPDHTFGQYIYYLFFLPTLFVGPINRFEPFLRDLNRRRWDSDLFSLGLTRILYGLAKIVFVAYFLISQKMNLWVQGLDSSNPALIQYLECWQYGLNLYFQFSGYCDIAIGISLLLGFRIPENFSFPFLKPNISQFWRNWHITLTDWSRSYIYPSVAAATRMPYLAILFSMIFIGLWHELSPKYLAWGLYHGLGIMAHRYFQRIVGQRLVFKNTLLNGAMWTVSVLVTVNFVMLGFVLTKEASLADSMHSFALLLGL